MTDHPTKLARAEARIERLEEDNRRLLRKLELTEESLRVERKIQDAVARRRSANGNGLHR